MFLISQEYEFRYGKGVKSCPCCGAKAYFGCVGSASYAITCSECGMQSKPVGLPNYWRKGSKRLWSRLYTRSCARWNKRNPYGRVDMDEVNRVLDRLKGKKKLP